METKRRHDVALSLAHSRFDFRDALNTLARYLIDDNVKSVSFENSSLEFTSTSNTTTQISKIEDYIDSINNFAASNENISFIAAMTNL